jgi:adenylate cyclase class 2
MTTRKDPFVNTAPDLHDNSAIEAEAKLAVTSLGPIEAALLAAGAALKAPRVLERNNRYDDANGALRAAHQVLRLRQDSRTRLTYKEPLAAQAERDPDLNARTELEVTVDDFDTMHLILIKLGYRLDWVYEKYRTTYVFQGCEVVLDELPFGNFVEIEGEPSAIGPVRAALGLDRQPNIPNSYADLFTGLKNALKLNVENLTFAEFEGITLPIDWVQDFTTP